MKAVQELVAYFDRRGALSPRQLRKLLDQGFLAADAPQTMIDLCDPVGATFYFRVRGAADGIALGHRRLHRRFHPGGRCRPCRPGQSGRERDRQSDGGGAACRSIRARRATASPATISAATARPIGSPRSDDRSVRAASVLAEVLQRNRICGGAATSLEHLPAGSRLSGSCRYLAIPFAAICAVLKPLRAFPDFLPERTAAGTAQLPQALFPREELAGGRAGGPGTSMDAKTDLKSRLPSRHVTEGPARAPHRSYYYAMGLTKEQIHQPFVGVASCWNEAAPCNIALMRQAQAVKKGVAANHGTPREFCTITVTDGIAMGHAGMYSSLPSREVIADSVELTMRGHGYDGLVGLAGCDKSLPGMMMAMVRLNVPSVFIYGGSILPGNFRGQVVTVQDMFEAVGRHSVGSLSERRPRRDGAGRVPVGRRVRRAVYRQHHGDRFRGDRSCAAVFGRRAGALRNPRPVLHDRGRAGCGTHQAQHPAARYRHPEGFGKRRRSCGGLRRFYQRRAASSGHCA